MFNNCQMVYHYGNCLNTKKPFVRPCRLCIDHCPHQALSDYKEINAELCSECGLCMAICPSDGMVERSVNKLGEYILSQEDVVLNCPQTIPAGFEINCLGIFNEDGWKTLLLVSEHKKVDIYLGDCSQCLDKKACAHSVAILKELLDQWDAPIQLKLIVKPDWTEDEIPPKTRRKIAQKQSEERQGLIKSLRQKGMEKLEELLPGITSDETYPIPKMRQWLFMALESAPHRKVPFPAIKINERCTSCEVCTVICPQQALSKIKDNEKTKIIFEPLKCVACNRCVESCHSKAMSLKKHPLDYRHIKGKILVYEGSPLYCSKCGKQIFTYTDPPLCIVCASSENKQGLFK